MLLRPDVVPRQVSILLRARPRRQRPPVRETQSSTPCLRAARSPTCVSFFFSALFFFASSSSRCCVLEHRMMLKRLETPPRWATLGHLHLGAHMGGHARSLYCNFVMMAPDLMLVGWLRDGSDRLPKGEPWTCYVPFVPSARLQTGTLCQCPPFVCVASHRSKCARLRRCERGGECRVPVCARASRRLTIVSRLCPHAALRERSRFGRADVVKRENAGRSSTNKRALPVCGRA